MSIGQLKCRACKVSQWNFFLEMKTVILYYVLIIKQFSSSYTATMGNKYKQMNMDSVSVIALTVEMLYTYLSEILCWLMVLWCY